MKEETRVRVRVGTIAVGRNDGSRVVAILSSIQKQMGGA